LLEGGELLRTLQQEVQLRRQGAGARVAVEALQNGFCAACSSTPCADRLTHRRRARLVLPTPIGPSTTMN